MLKLRVGVAGAILAALLLRASSARADDEQDDDDRAVLAAFAGGGITVVAAGVGTTIVAEAKHRDAKNCGILGAQGAIVLSPIASHAIVGETKRGLYFAAPLLAAEIGSMALFSVLPGVLHHAPPGEQYWLATTLSVSFFGSAISVVDTFFAPHRRAAKAPSTSALSSFSFAPLVSSGTAGAMLFGSL